MMRYTSNYLKSLRCRCRKRLPNSQTVTILKNLQLFNFRGKRSGRKVQRKHLPLRLPLSASSSDKPTSTLSPAPHPHSMPPATVGSPQLTLLTHNVRKASNKSAAICDVITSSNADICVFTEIKFYSTQ